MGVIERSWVCAARIQDRAEQALRGVGVCWRAQSTVEYALVGALVVIAAATTLSLLGNEVTTIFGRMKDALAGATPSGR